MSIEELDDATFEFGLVTIPVGGVTATEVDDAIAAALTALTIPADLNDLDDVSGTPATGDLLQYDGSGWVPYTPQPITVTFAVNFIIDGGGSTITTGTKGDLSIPFVCTITSWTLLSDQSGSIQVDIWKDTFGNFPPTDADSITAAAPPLISSGNRGTGSSLTGWTTSIAAGDILRFNVDSVTSIQRVTVALYMTREVGP